MVFLGGGAVSDERGTPVHDSQGQTLALAFTSKVLKPLQVVPSALGSSCLLRAIHGRALAKSRCMKEENRLSTRKADVRLPGNGNPNSYDARPVHRIISMMEWIRTSRLSIKDSLSRLSKRGGSKVEDRGGGPSTSMAHFSSSLPFSALPFFPSTLPENLKKRA